MDHSHRGRLIDHIHLKVRDIDASRRFYRSLCNALGLRFGSEGPDFFYIDELYVSEGKPLTSGLHLAFQAPSRERVERFHTGMIASGYDDFGQPGERPYQPGYYAAFVIDPDGNNIEAVHHDPQTQAKAATA